MKVIDIIKILGEMGGRFPKSQLYKMMDYFSKMLTDGRIILIQENGKPHAVMAFSIGQDYENFYQKGTWDFKVHDPSGTTLYIELLVCKKWTKELRRQFESEIIKRFPQLEIAHWHRWANWGDRHVTIRRSQYV